MLILEAEFATFLQVIVTFYREGIPRRSTEALMPVVSNACCMTVKASPTSVAAAVGSPIQRPGTRVACYGTTLLLCLVDGFFLI